MQLDSVVLEHYLYAPGGLQGFAVGLFEVIPGPFPQVVPVAPLECLGQDAGPTQWPDQTAYVVYAPGNPVALAPRTEYVVGAMESPAGLVEAALIFTPSENDSSAEDWRMSGDYFGVLIGEYAYWSATPFSGRLKCSVNASAPPNLPPDISNARPSIEILWPPNNRMVNVQIEGVTDPDGDPVQVILTSVQQNEPVSVSKKDRNAPDAILLGSDGVLLRAERLGNGNGRTYWINFTASDGKPGGEIQGAVAVFVPHDQSPPGLPSAAAFDSTKL
jgi:hypothetical protein